MPEIKPAEGTFTEKETDDSTIIKGILTNVISGSVIYN